MVRSIHFPPAGLRVTADAPEIPSDDERRASKPGKSIIGNTDTAIAWSAWGHGNHALGPEKVRAMGVAFAAGLTTQAVARQFGVAVSTVAAYRRKVGINTPCLCGKPGGHRGRCRA